jgi:hypothetical protein
MAIAGTAPMAVMFAIVLSQTLPKVVDPCVIWNFDGYVAQRVQQPCSHHMGIPDSKSRFLVLSLGMPAAMLLLDVLGIVGAHRSERRVVLAVSLILFVITGPLMLGNFGLVTLISAICFLTSSFVVRS